MNNFPVMAEHVVKKFGEITALDGVNLTVQAGERLALLGHNGAGKTTLIKLLLGLTRPTSGQIRILGGEPGSHNARRRCAYLPENLAFHKSLTSREQLGCFLRLKGEPASLAAPLLDRVGLADAMDRPITTLSKGMRQRVGLAQLLIARPDVVILDEPTNGLDPSSRQHFYATIAELAEAGTAILICSHLLTEMEARTERITILRNGRVIATGTLAELRKRAQLPIRLQVRAAPGKAAELAAKLGASRCNGSSVELRVDPDRKIDALSAISAQSTDVEDVDLFQPSLEDLYQFYCDPAHDQEVKK